MSPIYMILFLVVHFLMLLTSVVFNYEPLGINNFLYSGIEKNDFSECDCRSTVHWPHNLDRHQWYRKFHACDVYSLSSLVFFPSEKKERPPLEHHRVLEEPVSQEIKRFYIEIYLFAIIYIIII